MIHTVLLQLAGFLSWTLELYPCWTQGQQEYIIRPPRVRSQGQLQVLYAVLLFGPEHYLVFNGRF